MNGSSDQGFFPEQAERCEWVAKREHLLSTMKRPLLVLPGVITTRRINEGFLARQPNCQNLIPH